MLIEAAQELIEGLSHDQRDLLENSHCRYMAFAYVIHNDAYASQAAEDRKSYAHLLKFNEDDLPAVLVQRASEFMAAVSGLPVEWCRAWDAYDFYETHGVTLEDASQNGHI